MLAELFPRAHARYASLPVIGRHLDRFATWLRNQGHSSLPISLRIRAARRLDALLQRQGVRDPLTLTARELLACLPGKARSDIHLAAVIRSLVRYFEQFGMLAPAPGRNNANASL